NEDRPALPHLLIVELAASVFELANHRRPVQGAVLAIRPIDAPLTRLRIVKTKGEAFDVACFAVGFKFLQVGAATPNLSRNRSAIKFHPGSGTSKAILQAG